MSEFYNNQWRLPNNENKNKVSNYSLTGSGTVGISQPAEVGITSSYSFWMNRNSSTSNTANFYNVVGTAAYGMFFLGSSGIYIRYGGAYEFVSSTELTNAILQINVWQNWTITRKEVSATAQDVKLYVDSVKVVEVLNTTRFGTLGSSVKQVFGTGSIIKMDSFSVFDYELTQAQITTLYGSSSTGIGNPMSLSPKPVAYYPLGDQDSFNGADYLVPNSSLKDYVFDFNGTSSKILTTEENLGTTNSISFWHKRPTGMGSNKVVIGGNTLNRFDGTIILNGQQLIIGFTNEKALFIGGQIFQAAQNASSVNIPYEDVWVHYCITRNGTTQSDIKLYVNSYLVTASRAEHFGAPDYTTNTTILNLGAASAQSIFSEGELSNISTFPSAFTQAQVNTLYNNGTPSDISSLNPNNWWKLNASDTYDGTNWTIEDHAGSNDGTSSGMTQASLVQSDLSFTSGYSPYALDFDGTDQAINLNSAIALTGNRSVNFWFTWRTSGIYLGGATGGVYYPYILSTTSVYLKTSGVANTVITIPALQVGVFYNMCITGDGTTVSIYINGSLAGTGTDIANITLDTIANTKSPTTNGVNGNMSNVAIWDDTVLSQSEITEIYNSGVPSNLNTFSGTAPTSWWQLGSNSSFNTNWNCLDEIGTNNGVSVNMDNNDIVNGPGYSASGLRNSSIDIVGDAPYSTANALSVNMDVLDRVEDTPS